MTRRVLGRDPEGRVTDIEVAGEGVIGGDERHEHVPQLAIPDLTTNAAPQVRATVNAILAALRNAGVIEGKP